MQELNKKLKRILCLILVCLLLTPMVSFATVDDDSDGTADGTESGSETGAVVPEPEVDSEFEELTEKEAEKLQAKQKANALAKATVKEGKDEIDGHKIIAESSTHELYLEESSLSIIVRDIETGAVMRSEPIDFNTDSALIETFANSGVSITIIEKRNGTWQIIDLTARYGVLNDDVDVTTTVGENGFTSHIKYNTYGIEFDLNVSLDEEGLHVEVPMDTLKESNDNYRLNSLFLYPLLGATKLDYRTGSMFIPDGSGVLIGLDNYESKYGDSIFSMRYYGADAGMSYYSSDYYEEVAGSYVTFYKSGEEATMPVFGMTHTDTKMAMLGVVDKGASSAYVIYTLNSLQSWNLISARFLVRDTYEYPTSKSGSSTVKEIQPDINMDSAKITYLFTNGDEADYAGLAVKYREKLIKDGILVKKNTDYKLRMDFLGVDKENFLVFKRSVTMTTVDNIRNIYKELEEEGVTDILSVYEGWQSGGVHSLPMKSYKADSSIGGTKELTDLFNELQDSNIDLYLNQDSQSLYPDMVNATFISLEKVNKRVFQWYSDSQVFYEMRLVVPKYTVEYIEDFAKECKNDGVTNLAFTGITNNLFSYSDSSKIYNRKDTMETYRSILEGVSDDFSLVLNTPYQFMWEYADAYTDIPMGSSNYVYADQDVPFLSIVLKGSVPIYSQYVNFEAEKTKFYLQLIENGVYPSFLITEKDPSYLQNTDSSNVYSSKFELYKDTIVEYYNDIKSVNDKTKDAYIIDHEKLDSGVNVTTYDNGVKVYTNYSENAVIVDGLTIEGLSYKVGEAK